MFTEHKVQEMVAVKRNTAEGEYLALRKWADKSKLACLISFDQFKQVAIAPCARCGGKTKGYETNMLEAQDPARGYRLDNLLVSCWECHWGKKKKITTTPKKQYTLEQLMQTSDFPKKLNYKLAIDRRAAYRMKVPFSIGPQAYAEIGLKMCIYCNQLGERFKNIEAHVFWCNPCMRTLALGFNKDNLVPVCSKCLTGKVRYL